MSPGGSSEKASRFYIDELAQFIYIIMVSQQHADRFLNLSGVFCDWVLKEGGVFLFDLNMEEGYKVSWHDTWGIVEEDHVCVVRNDYRPEEKVARFDATIFRMQDGWQRLDLTLLQKCHSEAEVLSALEVAGFADIHAYAYGDTGDLEEVTNESERAFFICQKPAAVNSN